MLKRVLWTLPVLAIGMAIGGITLANVFASSTAQANTSPANAKQMMQQSLNTPQGQAMIQACSNFMSQFGQDQK